MRQAYTGSRHAQFRHREHGPGYMQVCGYVPDMMRAHHLYAEAGFIRLAERDWASAPGVILLAFGLRLGASS